MFKTIINAFRIKEIRKKLTYTIVMLIIVRIGCQIPLPGTDPEIVSQVLGGFAEGFGFFNALTGSSFVSMSIFALNITVYITASIIMQLLTIAFPKLEEMQKEGEDGRRKIAKITRYLTVGLALIESTAMSVGFGNQGIYGNIAHGSALYVWTIITSILALTGGSVLVMWMGEQITEKGVGNGISLVLLINIVSSMPADFISLYNQFIKGASSIGMAVLAAIIILAAVVAVIVFIVYLNGGERRIAVQYSQKITASGKSYGGRASHIPLKVNTAGVIPIIFASSLYQFPVVIAGFTGNSQAEWTRYFTSGYWCNPAYPIYTLGLIPYIALIVFFAYFYTQVTFNPSQVADNIKKQGGFVPGIRPGKATEDYFSKVLKYLIFIGAIALIIVAVLPMVVSGVFNARLSFAGTSIIIVVGVILETAKQIESMMLVRNYSGFLAK
ncbi:MAG: preprotein translocase subunit SecY [Lachnospiraceae bacterium]|jgi:preprotein translocase subunit SecY